MSIKNTVNGFILASLLATIPVSANAGLFDRIFRKTPPTRQKDTFPPAPAPKANKTPSPSTGRFSNLAAIGNWRLLKTQWSAEDEQGFSDFVRAIGRSRCSTVDSCIRHEANPFRDTDPSREEYKFWSDCADWPYFLRSYYAWKNGLPVVFSESMTALPLSEEQQASIDSGKEKAQTDVRYSWNGNRPNRQIRLPFAKGVTNFFSVHETIQNSVHTATMRVDPRTSLGDLYTPEVRAGAIRPGTIVYDPSGHVGIVYDITKDGQVRVFDALIDQKSISPRRSYNSDFYKRSKIAHGGWFQNFRPVIVEGAQFDNRTQSLIGGTARLLSNEEISDYSTEMFGNTKTADGLSAYRIDNVTTTSFQEFMRRRMFTGKFKLDIMTEFKNRLQPICDDFKSRVSLVQDGTISGTSRKPHASVLPNTIYGGDGDWDLYSTPGGDVRRRNSVNSIVLQAKELNQFYLQSNPEYTYSGTNLKADMISAASETMKTCSITYVNSNNVQVKVSLENLLKRLALMSFSPWHCVELRWGATSTQELASCPDLNNQEKMRWYRAQQTLRNQMARDTNIFTGYSLEELEEKAATLGPAQPANYNLLQRLAEEL